MQIKFDSISPVYLFPLSKSEVRSIKTVLPDDLYARIREIQFGCNTRTTQEAKVDMYTSGTFRIRVNFCLKQGKTKLLWQESSYLSYVRMFGGAIDRDAKVVRWQPDAAKRYAYFLIFHEIAHVIFVEQGRSGTASSGREEKWCDRYAAELVNSLTAAGGVR